MVTTYRVRPNRIRFHNENFNDTITKYASVLKFNLIRFFILEILNVLNFANTVVYTQETDRNYWIINESTYI